MTSQRSTGKAAKSIPPHQLDGCPRRLIAVGIRDQVRDRHALAWAVSDAVAERDTLHVVHAYVPLKLDGCSWAPVTVAREMRQSTAQRKVAQAVQFVADTDARIDVSGSAVAGRPRDVLDELSTVVDLLVIGEDLASQLTGVGGVQDTASCPLVCVPNDEVPSSPGLPVTVLGDDFGLSEAALQFGFSAASRRGTTVQVARSWASLHESQPPTTDWLAHQQEELDIQLADWQLRFPEVGVVARVGLEHELLDELRCSSQLLVVGRPATVGGPATLGRPATAARRSPTRFSGPGCPTVVVPEAVRAGE